VQEAGHDEEAETNQAIHAVTVGRQRRRASLFLREGLSLSRSGLSFKNVCHMRAPD
jgi:hypothetical protein